MTMTLLDFIKNLLGNDELRQDFAQDPQGTLHDAGLDGVSPADIHDALILAEDDSQHADFSRSYDTGHNSIGYSAPPPPVHHDYATPAASHEVAAQYLNNYVTNNYIDDRDTTVDNSVNQQIDTHGGNFAQDIDNHSATASGDGAVAVSGDVSNSPITTGDNNQVGDGNVKGDGNVVGDHNQAVTGDHNTTAFGSGDATTTTVGGDVHVGAGGAFGSGGDTTVDNSDNSVHDSGNTNTDNSVNNSGNDSSDHSIDHSFNHDDFGHGV
ncbi:MAG: IniB N-terminal domain-containing protein, partial [Rhodospirillales bacterium]|nr:IniB N-terminal domain-containing protein [Rhodospirillales bacterium]